MRKLMWFTVGFAVAAAVGAYWITGMGMLLPAVICLALAAPLFFLKNKRCKQAAIVLLGCVAGFVGFMLYDQAYLAPARAMHRQTVDAAFQVSDFSYETNYGIAVDGYLQLDGKQYKTKAYFDPMDALSPGDRVTGSFQLRYTSGGGEEAPTYHQGMGIFLLAYSRDVPIVEKAEKIPWQFQPAVLRQKLLQIIDVSFPADTAGFARALLLGDTTGLDYKTDTALKVSGIRHVVAVSGLHVSVLFSLIYVLAGKRKGLTALLGIPVLVLFCAVAGFTPSILRACIMQALMILAMLLNKEYDPPTALSFAVLFMLAVNPVTITSVSFQLSVGCMIGIFLFSRRIYDYWLDEQRLGRFKKRRFIWALIRWVCGSASVTLSAMSLTTPLCAYYFGMVSLVGIVTNLLALWVVSLIFYGIMAACLVYLFSPGLSAGIAWLVSWPIRYVLALAKGLGSFPLAAVYTESIYIVIWLALCYALLIVFLLSKRKRPILFSGCVAVGLVFALLFSWTEPRLSDYQMTVLNVGQGQCILLQSRGRNYLVDCGGDSDKMAADLAAEHLMSQGIYRLDGLILTHYDRDHAGGVLPLLSRIPADTLYLPDTVEENTIRRQLQQKYSDRIRWVEYESTAQAGEDILLIAGKDGSTDNESCLCVLFQPKKYDILITGDRNAAAERFLLENYPLPDLEVLVVGHHGAPDATSLALLQHTGPELAFISVGANQYGQPSDAVLERLALHGCRVLRTDLDGNIILKG